MESELKGISKNSGDESRGEGSGKDSRPLLKSDSTVSAPPSTSDTLQDLEKKYAPYVRRDAYGTMGRGELPLLEKFRLAVALVTLVPVRFVVGLLVLVLYYLICRLCTAFSVPYRGEDEQEDYAHMTGWRRVAIVRSGRFLSRAMLFVMGFYWISETHRIPPSWDKDADEVKALCVFCVVLFIDFDHLCFGLIDICVVW